MTKNLPFFVYGTLRHGEGNYLGLFNGNTIHEEHANIPHLSLYGNRGFPYAVINEQDDQGVQGELMYVSDDLFPVILPLVDGLEGYTPNSPGWNHYNRVIRQAVLRDGSSVEAYVYVASESVATDVVTSLPRIPDGNWFSAVKPRNPLAD